MKRYYRKNRSSVALFLVSNLLAAGSSVFMSFLLGTFADSAMEGDLSRVWKIALVTLFYLCIETFFAFLLDYSRDIIVQRVGRDLRADAVRKIEALSYMEKSEKDDGSCLSLVQNDVDTIQQDYVAALGEIYFQICCFLLAVASAIAIQPVMTLIMIAVSVLTAAFPKLTEKRLQAHQENEQQAKARYLTAITQIFSGFFQLKIFNAFSGINHAHDEANETLYRKKLRSRRIRRILYAGAYGCGNLVVLGTWVLGLFFVTRGVITLPALITFAGLMSFVAGPVQIISERYSSTIAASAVCKRVLAFLDAPTDEADSWGSEPLTQIKTVTLNDISCRRDDREILKHVDLTLRKGDRVALLGESGAGKSTLLKVLASMYAAEGEYAINGRPCRDYRYEDFRRQVTLLSQKTFVYSASIRDNLTMFSGTAQQDEALTKTLADAGLSKWYAERGASMDTQIGGEEHALSGGEERRLDLARTLWRKGSLVMLDEPAAAALRDPDRRHAQLFPGVFGQLHQGAPHPGRRNRYVNSSLCDLTKQKGETNMHFTYRTKGTCSQEILFDVDGKTVKNIEFIGGCNGNLQGISKLVEGMDIDTVIERLDGIHCGMKETSCPDQLASALKKAREKLAEEA